MFISGLNLFSFHKTFVFYVQQKSACNCYTQMDIGEVKVADDQDFLNLKHLVEEEPGWTLEFNKENTKVWTKPAPTTNFKMVKVKSFAKYFKDVLNYLKWIGLLPLSCDFLNILLLSDKLLFDITGECSFP